MPEQISPTRSYNPQLPVRRFTSQTSGHALPPPRINCLSGYVQIGKEEDRLFFKESSVEAFHSSSPGSIFSAQNINGDSVVFTAIAFYEGGEKVGAELFYNPKGYGWIRNNRWSSVDSDDDTLYRAYYQGRNPNSILDMAGLRKLGFNGRGRFINHETIDLAGKTNEFLVIDFPFWDEETQGKKPKPITLQLNLDGAGQCKKNPFINLNEALLERYGVQCSFYQGLRMNRGFTQIYSRSGIEDDLRIYPKPVVQINYFDPIR
ncbi:MAG: hypothetical protein HYY52_07085 [Candidatus Melainabacteria bacterium]|nr:hypothetical protein [Candidatus Melainabacteria bacterium]